MHTGRCTGQQNFIYTCKKKRELLCQEIELSTSDERNAKSRFGNQASYPVRIVTE